MRRTQETEALVDVEAFIHSSLDCERTQPLLDLLGVRSTPTGPNRLLECLRALATSEHPPIHEVERWYRRLDQLLDDCATESRQQVKDAFASERLILTSNGTWATVASVFLASDEEAVPGAAVVRESVANLALWQRLGVVERPTAELVLNWLKELPSGQKLSQPDLMRVRALLARHPVRVWEECGHWVSLAGEWSPTSDLCYALTMQSLIPWSHLHEWAKQRTADLQRLSDEVSGALPFSALPSLASSVEERFHRDLQVHGESEEKAWLKTVGSELCRIKLDDLPEADRVRNLARRLANTRWQHAAGLEIVPYIDGTPVGTSRHADVLWLERVLYVNDLPKAKLAKRVPEELGKVFGRPEIKAALDFSFDRSPEDVQNYLKGNFELAPLDHVDHASTQEGGSGSDVTSAPIATGTAADPTETPVSKNGAPPEPQSDPTGDIHDEARNEKGGPSTDRPSPPRTPSRPSVMERFAEARGFRRDHENGFFHHPDGSRIAKTSDGIFPWVRSTPSGDVGCYYWPKDHCLDSAPLVVETEVWGMIDRHPQVYALVLADAHGEAIEMTGLRLRELREHGQLTLHPAAYRLVVKGDQHA